jgi:hypothetical protein
MGAVSAIGDIDAPQAAAALIAAIPHLTESNRQLALDALLRSASRASALLDAVNAGTLEPATLGQSRIEKLRAHDDPGIQDRARRLLRR